MDKKMYKKITFLMVATILLLSLCLFALKSFSNQGKSINQLTNNSVAQLQTIQNQIYIRIIKSEKILELWVKQDNDQYSLYKSYPICYYSGGLGPKKREGDGKSPEGFYATRSGLLNPNSQYHLSFNIGYPNSYDKAQGYTGSFIMIHGKCVSIGCYAMTDPAIEEIYQIVKTALSNHQSQVPIHIFPFSMTDENMKKMKTSPHIEFWQELVPAYRYFEEYKKVPNVIVTNGQYQLDSD